MMTEMWSTILSIFLVQMFGPERAPPTPEPKETYSTPWKPTEPGEEPPF